MYEKSDHSSGQTGKQQIRAQAKARARARDEERLRAGEVSPRELQQENLAFRGFRKGVIGFGPKLKPKSAEHVAV